MNTRAIEQPVLSVQTEVSQYERVSGGLSASIIVVGSLSLVLLLVWSLLGSDDHPHFVPPKPGLGATENPPGVALDIEEPGVEEFPEVAEPVLAEALEAVDVQSTVKANDNLQGEAVLVGRGRGLGDRRVPGIGEKDFPNDDQPWKRWEIDFKVTTIKEYAKQLDHFQIELAGAELKGDSVIYCSDVSASPKRREGLKRDEKRIFFQHAKPTLKRWDLTLLQRAGVEDVTNRTPVQFYPSSTIAKMYALEQERIESDKRTVKEIDKTFFTIQSGDGEYQFVLSDVTYK